mgnify:CR=1 FL=1
MKKTIAISAALALALAAAGCDEDEDGDIISNAQACSNVMSICPTGYSWSAYVTSEGQCVTAFDCVDAFYTGDCRASFEDGIRCLQDLDSAAGCAACDAIMTALSSTCAYPAGCL